MGDLNNTGPGPGPSIEEIADSYNDKIETIATTFSYAITDLASNYLLSKNYPNSAEYSSAFNTNNTQVQGLQSSMLSIKTTLDKATNAQTTANTNMAEPIAKQVKKIEELKTMMVDLGQLNDGNVTMKSDFSKMYNYQYLRNFCLFIGILFLLFMFFYIFKDKLSSASSSYSSSSSSSYSASASASASPAKT
jgi:hypothetical protein